MNFITVIGVVLGIFAHLESAYGMSGDATYYTVGMTDCGQDYKGSDYVAGIAFDYWTIPNPNDDPMCQRTARVTDPQSGRSVNVRIKDQCEACNMEDIELSMAAFQKLRPLSVGRFHVNWEFTN